MFYHKGYVVVFYLFIYFLSFFFRSPFFFPTTIGANLELGKGSITKNNIKDIVNLALG